MLFQFISPTPTPFQGQSDRTILPKPMQPLPSSIIHKSPALPNRPAVVRGRILQEQMVKLLFLLSVYRAFNVV